MKNEIKFNGNWEDELKIVKWDENYVISITDNILEDPESKLFILDIKKLRKLKRWIDKELI